MDEIFKHKTREEMENGIIDLVDRQREIGFQHAIELVMETCHFELSVDSKRFLMGPIGKRYSKQSSVPKFWRPPPYDQVDDYIEKSCEDDVIITLGTVDGEELLCGLEGEVECLDLNHCAGEVVLC